MVKLPAEPPVAAAMATELPVAGQLAGGVEGQGTAGVAPGAAPSSE
jgi:hypothetical protein